MTILLGSPSGEPNMNAAPRVELPLPDYQGGSVVNLMSSLLSAMGAPDNGHPQCRLLDADALAQADTLIVWIIDGLGDRFLCESGRAPLLEQHRIGALSSVFPSTTAAAITTFLTGQAPQQHGLTGWFVQLNEAGGVYAVLPCEPREAGLAQAVDPDSLARSYAHQPIFDRLNRDSYVVSPQWILDSAFNRQHSGKAKTLGYGEDLASMFTAVAHIVQSALSPKYLYVYWPELDRLSHLYGQYSETVMDHLRELNDGFERLLAQLRGRRTLILLTADHGFIDTEPERVIHVNDHPRLQACLQGPLSGEPRLAYCYLKPDCHTTFTDYLAEHFPHQLQVVPSTQLLTQHAFGLGPPHPRLAERIGDMVLVMQDNYVIKDWLPTERRFFHRGIHGGVSKRESMVPLIQIEI